MLGEADEGHIGGWRSMAAAGIQAVNCHRGGKKARRYVFELRERIEEMLKGIAVG